MRAIGGPGEGIPVEMHQIRYFLAVSRTLNFTRGADDCHVAQPSLTRAIKLLEAELGGDLFRRERSLTHLTEFGQRMLPLLRQCYESALAAKSLALSIRTGSAASLTLALSHSISIAMLMDPLSELMRAFPGLELRFLRGDGERNQRISEEGRRRLRDRRTARRDMGEARYVAAVHRRVPGGGGPGPSLGRG
jgi:DNA-binding transcriptional LysR family regulator